MTARRSSSGRESAPQRRRARGALPRILRATAWLAQLASVLAACPAAAVTFVVTGTGDAGVGSLRQAILDANAEAGADTITFAIPATDPGCVTATGVCTIVPASGLPQVSDAVVIDGYTQAGAAANTSTVESRGGLNGALKVVLQGPAAGGNGLGIVSGGATVRGLVIRDFPFGVDIVLSDGGAVVLEGNYIGTDPAGALAAPNAFAGIRAGGASGTVVIGGTTPAARNLVSGNAGPGIFLYSGIAATIQGNLIGSTASGTQPLPNVAGISAEPASRAIIVGGDAPGAGNLVSRNGHNVLISGAANHVVQGNLIGPDITGMALLGPLEAATGVGIRLRNASTSLIGGRTAAARNVVSGNNTSGIVIENVVGTSGPGGNRIEGNYVGTGLDGATDLGNGGIGIALASSPGSVVGGDSADAANVVAFTKAVAGLGGVGVVVGGTGGHQSILGNSIHSNASLGIDLVAAGAIGTVTPNDPGDADAGPNELQNFPLLAASVAGTAATVSGTLDSTPGAAFGIELFASEVCDASGNGEGRTLVGRTSVTTDAAGLGSFGPLSLVVPAGQARITATATNADGSTSEFSACATTAATSITNLASSPNPSLLGQSVTFTATVEGSAPSGTVEFREGATVLGTSPLQAAVATLATSTLTLGSHPITAIYGGDAGNPGSASQVLVQVVDTPAPNATTTTLASSLNPSRSGDPVTFTATVTGTSPTGFVEFRERGAALGTASLSGGIATLTTSALARGSHPLVAAYGGDADDAPSVSPLLVQVVDGGAPPPTSVPLPLLPLPLALLLAAMVCMLGMRRLTRRP